jgi:MFS family permease
MSDQAASTPARSPRIPRAVWVLGFVSLLTDMSSEFIHALLPVFLAGTLGASALAIGVIEGAAEGLALATKVFSGYLSDVFGRRKPLIVLGYGLAALTKPLFPLAGSVHWVLGARLLDRVGKGIRGAPRDALIADVTPKEVRGAAFGMRQALDTVGGFAGPLLAIGAMLHFAGEIRSALWIAVVPGLVAVGLLVFLLREPESAPGRVAAKLPLSREGLRRLGGAYWRLVALGSLLTFARSTEAFLVLRGSNLGLSNTLVPLVLVAMSLVYTLAAYPAGKWSDSGGRRPLLIAGMIVLALADVVLALAGGLFGLFAGIALWGLHMGLTQGLFAAYIADLAPGELRGTAFGVFNLATGVVLLAASALSGLLWDVVSPAATFWMGAILAVIGAAALFALPKAPAQKPAGVVGGA